MSKLPKWQRTHIQKCRTAFGIGDATQDVIVRRQDEVNGDPQCSGKTVTTPRYLRAEVKIRRDLPRSRSGYETVTHELLHAAMPLQQQTVRRIIDLLPAELHDHAWALWADANEATVTRLAKGLTPLLQAMEDLP